MSPAEDPPQNNWLGLSLAVTGFGAVAACSLSKPEVSGTYVLPDDARYLTYTLQMQPAGGVQRPRTVTQSQGRDRAVRITISDGTTATPKVKIAVIAEGTGFQLNLHCEGTASREGADGQETLTLDRPTCCTADGCRPNHRAPCEWEVARLVVAQTGERWRLAVSGTSKSTESHCRLPSWPTSFELAAL